MFSKISRYRDLRAEVTTDAKGRVLESTTLRLLPEAAGEFQHSVEEIDRLDHLAYKYYKQPRSWWRIVDANPSFLSPQALLGKEPESTVQVPLEWEGPAPPWSGLLKVLSGTFGVLWAGMGTAERPLPEVQLLEGGPLLDIDPALRAELDASAESQVIPATLRAALSPGGVSLSDAVRIEKPTDVSWLITDLEERESYVFRYFESENSLRVFSTTVRHDWVVVATYNTIDASTEGLLSLVEGQGFTWTPPAAVGRIGKQIVIPPRLA